MTEEQTPAFDSLEQTIRSAKGHQFVDLDSLQRIGPYRITGELGRGGMGRVYLAIDERLQREVALKVMQPEFLLRRQAYARFLREARAASRLDHANICRVYDVGEAEGVPYIAMQRVHGTTLAARIADLATWRGEAGREHQGGTPWEQTLVMVAIAEKIACALHLAHEHGLVHRDVKPGNIMVREDGEPVLLDFGVARDARDEGGSLTASGQLVGTPRYMSPEQVRGAVLDGRSDVFCLGATLFECLTGRRPFAAVSEHEELDNILRSPTPHVRSLNRAVPRDLGVVVERALQKAPGDRYHSAAALAEDLRRVRAREPILARRVGSIERLRRWTQRNPVAAAYAATVTVAVLALAWLWNGVRNARAGETRALASFDLLGLGPRLRRAVAALDETHHLRPHERDAALQNWLTEGEYLSGSLREVRPELARLRTLERDKQASDRERALLVGLSALEGELVPFAEAPDGELQQARDDLAWARDVRRLSVETHADDWRQAIESIRGNERYHGLAIPPQVGLVPLGPDPDSRLWEFYDLSSAPRDEPVPSRDESGHLSRTRRSGIVLVLLPPGTFAMGAQASKSDQENYDENAQSVEGPVHSKVQALPFFLAKHELTRAQWMHWTKGKDPSATGVGVRGFTALHPVDNITWPRAERVLKRFGLELPTSAQWEYACRAGTSSPFGIEAAHLAEYANLADATGLRQVAVTQGDPALDDGYPLSAPIGTYRANAFGLFDMLGNVRELVFDDYCRPQGQREHTQEIFSVGEGADKTARGGSFRTVPRDARCSCSWTVPLDYHMDDIGVRPARSIYK